MRLSKKTAFGILLGAILCLGAAFAAPVSTVVASAAARTVSIDSCLISGSNVNVTVSASSIPSSDDGKYYVFADEVYEDGPVGEVVATARVGSTASFSFPLNLNVSGDNLNRKFIIAVRQGGSYAQVSNEHYITNPEAASTTGAVRLDHGIKGLLPSNVGMDWQLEDLRIQQVAYNVYLGDIVGETTDASHPTIYYDYDGATYSFNGAEIYKLDAIIWWFTYKGFQTNLTILNSLGGQGADLIHPLSRDKLSMDCPCYAFNTAESGGAKHLKAVAAFLGQRYNGTQDHGQVDNWLIGNEVNARSECFYMSNTDLDFNVSAYNKAFRIFYNGIKSMNSTAQVYIPLDQEWGRKSNPGCFLSKDFLDSFNYYITREGNIDWGLAFHPYNAPLFDAYTWQQQAIYVNQTVSTPYITMENLNVLTDYMQQASMLSPTGAVRSISLSEIGFTSAEGEDLQAASVVYGYMVAANNPFIDGFILYRETDNEKEMLTNIIQGLCNTDGSPKMAYDFYKYIDTAQAATYKQKASNIIGADVDTLVANHVFMTRN